MGMRRPTSARRLCRGFWARLCLSGGVALLRRCGFLFLACFFAAHLGHPLPGIHSPATFAGTAVARSGVVVVVEVVVPDQFLTGGNVTDGEEPDAKTPDEGVPVAVEVDDGGQLHPLVHRLDRSWGQAPPRDFGDVAVQVVHREVHQAPAGAVGVEGDLDPATLGHPPFDEATLHWQVVAREGTAAYVPNGGSFHVGHRYNGKDR